MGARTSHQLLEFVMDPAADPHDEHDFDAMAPLEGDIPDDIQALIEAGITVRRGPR